MPETVRGRLRVFEVGNECVNFRWARHQARFHQLRARRAEQLLNYLKALGWGENAELPALVDKLAVRGLGKLRVVAGDPRRERAPGEESKD